MGWYVGVIKNITTIKSVNSLSIWIPSVLGQSDINYNIHIIRVVGHLGAYPLETENLYLESPSDPQGKHANPLFWKARSSGQSLTFFCWRSEDFIGILLITEKANSERKSELHRWWRNFCLRTFILQLHNHSFVLKRQKFIKTLLSSSLESLPQKRLPFVNISARGSQLYCEYHWNRLLIFSQIANSGNI